jgi:hypothetical protein
MLGDAQSGYPRFRAASLSDVSLIKETREAAEAALSRGAMLAQEAALSDFFPSPKEPVHLE